MIFMQKNINIPEIIRQVNGTPVSWDQLQQVAVPEKSPNTNYQVSPSDTIREFNNLFLVSPQVGSSSEEEEGRALVNRMGRALVNKTEVSDYSNPASDALRNLIKELTNKISSAQAQADSAQRSVDKLWEAGEIRDGMKAYASTVREFVVTAMLARKTQDGHAQILPKIVDPGNNKFIMEFANNWLTNINSFADKRDSFKKDIITYQAQLKKANEDLAETLKNLTPEERAQEAAAAEEVKQIAASGKIKTTLGWILLGTFTIGVISVGVVVFKKWKKNKLNK